MQSRNLDPPRNLNDSLSLIFIQQPTNSNIVWYVKSTFLCPKDPLTRLVHENVRIESHTSMNSRAEWNGYKVVWINKRR